MAPLTFSLLQMGDQPHGLCDIHDCRCLIRTWHGELVCRLYGWTPHFFFVVVVDVAMVAVVAVLLPCAATILLTCTNDDPCGGNLS